MRDLLPHGSPDRELRVLIDLTNSPHVPFFAPLVRALRSRGHQVEITARRFAQTVELVQLHELDAAVIGSHGGAGRAGKARAALGRMWSLDRHVRALQRSGGRFDVALSHGSTDLPIVARRRGIPHVTIFDYEWARLQHRTNVRNSWRVVVPDSIPIERLMPYGAAGKIAVYPGLKEEYYLDPRRLVPDAVRDQLGISPGEVLVALRPPADMALYHRGISNELFGAVIDQIRATAGCSAVLLPRTAEQHATLRQSLADVPDVVIPEHAIDGASLVAAADLVVSAGGTMNREAAALGVPVYTVFAGRMGGVDEALLRSGRLRLLTSVDDVELVARADRDAPPRLVVDRSEHELLDILLDGLPVLARS